MGLNLHVAGDIRTCSPADGDGLSFGPGGACSRRRYLQLADNGVTGIGEGVVGFVGFAVIVVGVGEGADVIVAGGEGRDVCADGLAE